MSTRIITDSNGRKHITNEPLLHQTAPVQSCYCPNCEAMGKELAALKAQRQWVGMTDDEIFSVLGNLQRKYNGPPTDDSRVVFALAIEAKLKEKNT